MSSLMKLRSILTQQHAHAKPHLLEEILPLLKDAITLGKLSKIWIVQNDNFIISIDDGNNVYININNNLGKTLLTKIICLVARRNTEEVPTPVVVAAAAAAAAAPARPPPLPIFCVILEKDDINLRKIIRHHNENLKNDSETFEFLMRSFIIMDKQQYNMFLC